MEWVTTTAKTLPEAIDLALDNLGVDESEAEIVVLEEPSKGLFGRMRGTARVEARVKPRAIRPKHDRGRGRRSRPNGRGGDKRRDNRGKNSRSSNNRSAKNRSGGNKSGGGQSTDTKVADKAVNKSDNKAADKNGGGQGGGRRRGRGSNKQEAASSEAGNANQNGSNQSSNKNRGRGNKSNKSNKPKVDTTDGRSAAKAPQKVNEKETPVEEVAEHLRTFLGGLTEAFGLEGGVAIDDSETDVLVATVEGQHGLMVGPKGRTLDAIQELARVSSQRAAPSSIRIRVDVGGYRKQRAAALGEFARKAADKAVDNACEIALEPMSPADRKAVHDSLVEDGRVETRSVGTEPRRKVIVIPVEGAASGSEEE